jgi:beta-lactamase regulating signal transducer with metallopeptidase domain
MTAIEALLQQPASQAIGWALLQFVWQGALVGLLTAAALVALRRSAADVRYVVATIGLSLMLTMPAVTALQAWRSMTEAIPPGGAVSAVATLATAQGDDRALTSPAGATGVPVAGPLTDPGPQFSARSPLSDVTWVRVVLLAWLSGVAILTLRLLTGWIWVQRLRSHRTAPAPAAWQQIAWRLSKRLHIARSIRLLESSMVEVPTVIGWLRPVVLLPASAMAGMGMQQLEAILAHELAHIRRHDYLVNLLQTLVETLLFYHPAVWWLSRRIRIERENCCDDLAVSLCGDPYAYAKALADLEELRADSRHFVLAATGGSLIYRVRRLIGGPSHAGRGPGWLAGSTAVVLIASIAAGAVGRNALEPEQQVEAAAAVITSPQAGEASAPAIAAREQALPAAAAAVAPAPARGGPIASSPQVARVREVEPTAHVVPVVAAFVGEVVGSFVADVLEQFLWGVPPAPPAPPKPPTPQGRAFAAMPPPPPPPPPAVSSIGMPPERPAVPPAPPVPLAAGVFQTPPSPPPPPPAVPLPPVPPAPAVLQTPPTPPTPPSPPTPPAPPDSVSGSRQSRGDFTWSDGKQKLEVRYDGTVEFTDDDSDIKSLAPGGTLRIREGGWIRSRIAMFEADASGTIRRRYWDGTSEKPFEPEGRAWVSQVLPRIIRQSGLGAPARVARILKAKGPSGVLEEISLIEGSWSKRVYFTELLKSPGLDAATVRQALEQAGKQVDSDFELASLLIAADRLLVDDATRRTYFDAARTIGSDFEMRRVYSSALKRGPLSADVLAGVLDASTAIESDFEEAELLVQIAKLQPLDARTRAPFLRALTTVGSDFECRRVVSAVVRADPSPETLATMLDPSLAIDSDFEQASFLLDVVKSQAVEGPLRAPFFKGVETIGSSFERGRVLQAVAKRGTLSPETVVAVLRAVQGMGSSHETSQVLLAVAGAVPLSGEARDLYVATAERLGDFEEGRALSALVKSERRK